MNLSDEAPMQRHTFRRPLGKRHARRGAMIVLVVLMMVIFIAMVAFSVDVAYMQLTRTKLRSATDAAARAGAEALSRLQDKDAARAAAKRVAALNTVAGMPLVLEDADIVFGHSLPQANGRWDFTAGAEPTNAVRVNGRRTDGSPTGSVPLFFGSVLGTGDFEPSQFSTAAHLDRDIALVVDRSGSMAWDLSGKEWSFPPGKGLVDPPDPLKSRWAALTTSVESFIDGISVTEVDENVALVSYASGSGGKNAATLDVPLTQQYELVDQAVKTTGKKPIQGGTNIAEGIKQGIKALTDKKLTRKYAAKTMVLLTDGQYNRGGSPLVQAQQAAKQDIVIHTVTFSDAANQADMKAVAAATGGNHYHAPDAAALERIFREIALTLPVLFTE